jgi:hypothetical protein
LTSVTLWFPLSALPVCFSLYINKYALFIIYDIDQIKSFFVSDSFSLFGFTAQDLITSIQENQKKTASTLLERAKEICAKQGVYIYSASSSLIVWSIICILNMVLFFPSSILLKYNYPLAIIYISPTACEFTC